MESGKTFEFQHHHVQPKEKGILREKAIFWNMFRNLLSQVDSNKEVIYIFYRGNFRPKGTVPTRWGKNYVL